MDKYFLIRTEINNVEYVESELSNLLIDRESLVSLIRLIKFNNNKEFVYFVIKGLDFSCKFVMWNLYKKFRRETIKLKFFNYNNTTNTDINNLVVGEKSSDLGIILKKYSHDKNFKLNIKNATNTFLIKNKLMSNFVFCKSKLCGGYGEALELSSVQGIYKCNCCGELIYTEGPVLRDITLSKHLTYKEKKYLINNTDNTKLNLPST